MAGRRYKKWLDNPVGLSPELMPFYYVPTEYAGVTDHLMVSAVENGRTEAIVPQMQSLVNKAVNLATLQHKKINIKKLRSCIGTILLVKKTWLLHL